MQLALPRKQALLLIRHPKAIPLLWDRSKVITQIVKSEISKSQRQWEDTVRKAKSLGEIIRLSNTHWTLQQTVLYFVCRYARPKVVVETGVNYGVSSAFILQALQDNDLGFLYSIDLPNVTYVAPFNPDYSDLPLPRRSNTGFAVPSSLKDRWKLILGDSKIELPKLLNVIGPRKLDMFFHDSMHTYDFMTFEYGTVFPFIRSGGILASDDTHWNTAFGDFCTTHDLMAIYCHAKGFALVP